MKANLIRHFLAVAALVLFCAISVNSRAAVLTVTNTADSGPGTLRNALAVAANGDTIDATGLSGTITLFTGQLNVPSSVSILGPGPAALTVSGYYSSSVFNVTGTNVTISGLTIAYGVDINNVGGAGIYSGGSNGSVLTVSGCVITGNLANGNGGGIRNSYGVTMNISNCIFSGNSSGNNGGGIYNNSGITSGAIMTINACTFSGNSASNGGGIYNSSANLALNASTISSNSANLGAGIYNSSGHLALNASTVSSNSASQGGGIYNLGSSLEEIPGSSLTINASTFSGNSAAQSAGALINTFHGIAIINASTFNANTAPDAGIINTYGGYNFSILEIGDTILNAVAGGTNILNTNSSVGSAGYNLCSDNGGGFLTATGDQTNKNPLLGPLQNNGSPTLTHALLPGSPAIDQGKFNAVTNLVSQTDQRGFPRVVDNPAIANATGGDGSDIGAFEEQFSALTLQMGNVAGQPGQKNLVFTPWATGWSYALQFTTNPAVTPFAPLTGYAGPTTNGNAVTITDLNATGPNKFYRLLISLP